LKTKPNRTISKLIDLTINNKLQWEIDYQKLDNHNSREVFTTDYNITDKSKIKINIINFNDLSNLFINFYLINTQKQNYINTYYNVNLRKLFELFISAKYINNILNNPHFFNELISFDLEWIKNKNQFIYVLDRMDVNDIYTEDKISTLTIVKDYAVIKINNKILKIFNNVNNTLLNYLKENI
jgi:hypothetical protein